MPATSMMRLWRAGAGSLSFTFASAAPEYEPVGERITDRAGRVHRIAPATARRPAALRLALEPGELLRAMSAEGPPRPALTWLEEAFQAQATLTLFVLGASLDGAGQALERRLAYCGVLDELPGAGFGTLPGTDGGVEPLELRLTVLASGSFSDINDPQSASWV